MILFVISTFLTEFVFILKIVVNAIVIRQRKPWRRKDGVFLYFEGNKKKKEKN